MKNALFQLFSNHGDVHEVHAKANIRMRGQAHVVMRDEDAALATIKALRGYFLFEKPMRCNFSRNASDFTTKLEGTFGESVKNKREKRQTEEKRLRDVKAKRKLIDRLIRLRK